ncbi:hypothetical protein ACQP00_27550 [Dactylosporangium sp. CS-047395]|uniref:hypothetical protein n=1 Tax=Dactylosporangium sp. CS-047395 TaxID=3239936 RepID=UPI003D8F34BC
MVFLAYRGAGVEVPGLSAEPRTVEAARTALQHAIDRSAAGDAGGAWDLLSKRGQAAVSRADYIAYAQACPGIRGLTGEVTDVRLLTSDRAVGILKVLTFAVQMVAVYESGHWKWEPDAEQVERRSRPLAEQIAAAHADGSCQPGTS